MMDIQLTPTASPMASQPTPKLKRRRTWIGFLRDLLTYVMVYIVVSGLTIGPFFWEWFGAVYADGPKWIARIYRPLVLLCDIFPPLGWLINLWVNWWIL